MNTMPAEIDDDLKNLPTTLGWNMPTGLAIWFDERLFDHCMKIAGKMADAVGFIPAHLQGKQSACLAIVDRAINWKLSPFAVAMCTYQTPGGQIGFMGKLIQAILENSGRLVGSPTYEHFGDWEKLNGMFELVKGQRSDATYPKATWGKKEAAGLGVIVRAQIKGEVQPREWELLLANCYPLNSTLWATNPKKQICYTAIRGFSDIACPGLIMGVPWDDDAAMRDITPVVDAPAPARPRRENIATAGHEDLDQRYRDTVREPAPQPKSNPADASPGASADAGRSDAHSPESATGSPATGASPEAAAGGGLAAFKEKHADLIERVDASLANFSEDKALKNFYFTDASCKDLVRLGGDRFLVAGDLFDKHWARVKKAKAGGQ